MKVSLETVTDLLTEVRGDLEAKLREMEKLKCEIGGLRSVESYLAAKIRPAEAGFIPVEREEDTKDEKVAYQASFDMDMETGEIVRLPDPLEVQGRTRHEAAEIVLGTHRIAMTIPEIVSELERSNYEPGTDRRKLGNAIYMAMDRKRNIFTKDDNTKQWSLLRPWSPE